MVQVLLGFAGGLGLFLYGMKLMGDSLERPPEPVCAVCWKC